MRVIRLPIFRGFAGWRAADLGPDLLAGLTLAAIAIPEQMATARLAGLPPQAGFFAFIAGSIGFAIFGASRILSVGADSTIAPIFAGSLASLAAAGHVGYAVDAAALAVMVGVLVGLAGVLRLGFIGDLLSIPVTIGFLAGIAVHILASQAPAALGLPPPTGEAAVRLVALAREAGGANLWTLAIALGVAATIALSERLNRRIPGALLAVAAATLIATRLGLGRHGVASLGVLSASVPRLGLPASSWNDIARLAPLAALIALVVMLQTAAVSRAFPDGAGETDVDGDFRGAGAGSLVAGLVGAFPVNASPPRSAIVAESGGRSQAAGLTAAALIAALLTFGLGLLKDIPAAALAGVLLFVAARLVRVADIVTLARESPQELALAALTTAAVALAPTQWGVAAGVGLSVLHGAFLAARVKVQPFVRTPGTTVWWPRTDASAEGESVPDVLVLGFPAALSFINASGFAREFLTTVGRATKPRLAVLEGAGVTMIDFTAARALERVVQTCRRQGCDFALARLESPAAQRALDRLGLRELIGADHVFESVEEAVRRVGPGPPVTD
ncbi:MAG TPA: SulP family inorganic anion transporter [Caulobacteraceae bacterium]|jgi:MFS superfamily sulfate permease-like transporter|nr:SulP family inorganic anion transporter [Caulobacteraceae bacterium]